MIGLVEWLLGLSVVSLFLCFLIMLSIILIGIINDAQKEKRIVNRWGTIAVAVLAILAIWSLFAAIAVGMVSEAI